jgi:hypothetical protein
MKIVRLPTKTPCGLRSATHASFQARDHALGAAIHDMRIYTAGEVLYGMHYAEAVTVDDQLRPVADLTRLSLVEPDPSKYPE